MSKSRSGMSFRDFAEIKRDWSLVTFGPGKRTFGITEHIRDELAEVEHAPMKRDEWIDIILLAMDGYLRHGGTPDMLMDELLAKHEVNVNRTWPPVEEQDPDNPVEHVRSDDERE